MGVVKVWVYAHTLSPLEVTTYGEKGRSYLAGHGEVSAIIIEGEHAGTHIDRLYYNPDDMPALGQVDDWPIVITVTKVAVAERIDERTSLTVKPS